MAQSTLTGKVKFFKEDKGYGFIIEDGSNKEYFVHAKGCRQKVKTDDRVTFNLQEDKRGPVAVDVQLAN